MNPKRFGSYLLLPAGFLWDGASWFGACRSGSMTKLPKEFESPCLSVRFLGSCWIVRDQSPLEIGQTLCGTFLYCCWSSDLCGNRQWIELRSRLGFPAVGCFKRQICFLIRPLALPIWFVPTACPRGHQTALGRSIMPCSVFRNWPFGGYALVFRYNASNPEIRSRTAAMNACI